jgi:hypothetical protein
VGQDSGKRIRRQLQSAIVGQSGKASAESIPGEICFTRRGTLDNSLFLRGFT